MLKYYRIWWHNRNTCASRCSKRNVWNSVMDTDFGLDFVPKRLWSRVKKQVLKVFQVCLLKVWTWTVKVFNTIHQIVHAKRHCSQENQSKQSQYERKRRREWSDEEIEFSTGVKNVQKIDNGKFVDLLFDLTLSFCSSPFCHRLRWLFEETNAAHLKLVKIQSNCTTICF